METVRTCVLAPIFRAHATHVQPRPFRRAYAAVVARALRPPAPIVFRLLCRRDVSEHDPCPDENLEAGNPLGPVFPWSAPHEALCELRGRPRASPSSSASGRGRAQTHAPGKRERPRRREATVQRFRGLREPRESPLQQAQPRTPDGLSPRCHAQDRRLPARRARPRPFRGRPRSHADDSARRP